MKKQTKSTHKTNMRVISMTAVGRWKTAGKKGKKNDGKTKPSGMTTSIKRFTFKKKSRLSE